MLFVVAPSIGLPISHAFVSAQADPVAALMVRTELFQSDLR